MNGHVWVDPRLSQVRVSAVRAYLVAHGWQLQPYPGPELLVFGGPMDDDDQPIVQVLPSSERMRDYLLRLEELVTALSIIEDRPPGEVLTDMLRADSTNGPPAIQGQEEPSTPVAPN